MALFNDDGHLSNYTQTIFPNSVHYSQILKSPVRFKITLWIWQLAKGVAGHCITYGSTLNNDPEGKVKHISTTYHYRCSDIGIRLTIIQCLKI